MLKNFFIITWRNIQKSKIYSSINIVGLATGMAIALLIGLWIWDELSFDTYHTDHARIAQAMTTQTFNGERGTGPSVSLPMGNELRDKYKAYFKYVTLASWNNEHVLAAVDKKISRSGLYAQPELPRMLSLKMEKGSVDALNDPSLILLNESLSKALFGNEDPINKVVRIDNKTDLKVGGVFEDLPHNTSLYETRLFMAWDKYVSLSPWMKNAATEWDNHSFQLFVEMNDHADMNKASEAIKGIAKVHVKEGLEETTLWPMDQWRLYDHFTNGKVDGGRIQFVRMFTVIGIFVLLLACINFMNLSTARSEKRAREVGIRKTLGSLRIQLIGQLLSESVFMTLLSFVICVFMVWALLPVFNRLADKSMTLPWGNPIFWILTLGFTLLTGLISGSYPAFYLSSFEPTKVLKGTFRVGRLAALPRKVLVVIQFTVSVALIIGTVIVFRQIQYAKDRPVGYSRQGLITVNINTPDLYGHYNAIREDLLQTGLVENMAESNSDPTQIQSNQIGFDWRGKDPNSTPLFGIIAITHDYGRTIGWKIIAGRDFDRSLPTDSSGFVLNESAVKLIGLKNPIGETIKWNGKNFLVIGIAKDMIMQDPYAQLVPSIFFLNYGWTNSMIIRVKPIVPMQKALAGMEPVFKKYDPGSPFEYQFTDEEYAKKFSDEERIGNLAAIFAILAVFISCLGLFGLASFVAEQRTKEMGVRKVLGASTYSIWKLLSKEFVGLVILSCLIATPLAWYYLSQWLLKYTYHTPISWWIFVVAGIGTLLITVLTVSYHAIRAAWMNPVHSLRAE